MSDICSDTGLEPRSSTEMAACLSSYTNPIFRSIVSTNYSSCTIFIFDIVERHLITIVQIAFEFVEYTGIEPMINCLHDSPQIPP